MKTETFGERLIRLRSERNISQEEVANRLEISRQALSQWENDMASPKLDKIADICITFGVSADYLLFGGGETPSAENVGAAAASETAAAEIHTAYASRGKCGKIFSMAFDIALICLFSIFAVLSAAVFIVSVGYKPKEGLTVLCSFVEIEPWESAVIFAVLFVLFVSVIIRIALKMSKKK